MSETETFREQAKVLVESGRPLDLVWLRGAISDEIARREAAHESELRALRDASRGDSGPLITSLADVLGDDHR